MSDLNDAGRPLSRTSGPLSSPDIERESNILESTHFSDSECAPLLESTHSTSFEFRAPPTVPEEDPSSVWIHKTERMPWLKTCKGIFVCCALWVAYTLANTAFSMIDPFFPQVAQEKGVTPVVIGVIIAAAPLSVVLLSPICGYLLPKTGICLQVFVGLLMVGSSYLSLAFMILIDSMDLFIICCVFLRSMEGVGAAFLATAIFSTFPVIFPRAVGTLVGLFELGSGIGYSIGPLIGGVMYKFGGYRLPFLSVGIGLLVFVIPCSVILIAFKVKNEEKGLRLRVMFNLLTNVQFMVLVFSVVLAYYPLGALTPVLPGYLSDEYGQDSIEIGLMFFTNAFAYLCGTILVGPLTDKFGYHRTCILFGFLIITSGFFLTGIPNHFGYRNVPLYYCAFGLIGIGDAMAIVPIYSELLAIGNRYLKPGDSSDALASFISGLISASIYLCGLLWPVIGGGMATYLPVPECALIVGIAVAAQGLLVFGVSLIDVCTTRFHLLF